ncbi:MAG: undecaprenyl-phosphate glucose phosphotransferase [Lachnospiraceae bacterium]|nr:undecaprenyl-phosphate glucose phosphotransferase [Lachnospiraceae bacterium]MCI9389248.1 undecaprenyl-phosphate glucose phosphotransferase [Lachnospiraceae bacterium]MCI9471350.1 undecaprenyl-phosphate glucose phosphotransferase [Lachnospiraceae bacterium]
MIKDNQRYFNRLHVVFDALVIAMSYVTAWFIKFQGPFSETSVRVLSFEQYMSALVFIVPGFLILYYAFNLYTPKRMQGRRLELANITKASTLGVFLIMVALYVLRIIDFSRSVIFIFYGINIVAETLLRNVIRYILRDMRRRGFNQKHVLLVGYSRAAEEYVDRIITNPQWGYTVYGILDDDVEAGTVYKGISVIGRISDLIEILERESLDEIAITLGLGEYYRLEEIVALCEKSGVHTKFIPDYNNIIPTKPYTEDILGLPVINIRHVPLTNNFYALVKRIIDILGSLCGMALASPVMLAACLLIKITSPGPLIYRQERVGLHNKTFQMYKFRSMEVQKESEEKKAWTTKNDPRVTGIGKLMRRTSIDELPQLFNILKGDMSLVGPRPERPFFVEKFREEIPRYMVKHQVRPGLTGWAQVNGYRGDTSIRKRIEYDLYYIENWTLGFDVKILVLTVFKGFVNKNAY